MAVERGPNDLSVHSGRDKLGVHKGTTFQEAKLQKSKKVQEPGRS
jgi:hypothetical protein